MIIKKKNMYYLDRNSMTIEGGMTNDDGSRYYGGRMDQQLNPRTSRRGPSQQEMQQMQEAERLEQLENQISPGLEDYPISGPDTGPPKSVGIWTISSLIIAVVAILAIIIFIAWYFGSGEYRKGTVSSVKEIFNTEEDISPTLQNLTVKKNTTLGTNGTNTVTIKSSLDSDLVPRNSETYDLGTSSSKWGTVYVDNVEFDTGTSIIKDGNNIIVDTLQGGLGYRKPVKILDFNFETSDQVSRNLGVSESGYTYGLSVEGFFNRTGGNNDYVFNLPTATGSGVFYDFIFSDNIPSKDLNQFSINTSEDKVTGSVTVVSGTEGGASFQVFGATEESDHGLYINDDRPAINTGNSGLSYRIKKGSNISVTDYYQGIWKFGGTLFVDSGVSAGGMQTCLFT